MLSASFVVRHQASLVASTDLPHLDAGRELRREITDEFTEVDPVFGHVVEGHHFTTENGLGGDELDVEVVVLDLLLEDPLVATELSLQCFLVGEILRRGDPENPAPGMKGIVPPTGVLDVVEHLLAGDRLPAPGVLAGGGDDFREFDASMGADDQLGSAAGDDPDGVLVFADHAHATEADGDGLGFLELRELLLERQRIAVGGIDVFFIYG